MSESETPPDVTIDACGHRCPTPTLRLRRGLEACASGAVVLLLADDPLARIDVPHFLTQGGHALLGTTVDGRRLGFLIRKG